MAKIARVVDFETDGLPEEEESTICEVAFVDVDLTSPTFDIIAESRFESLIKTDRPMPIMAKSDAERHNNQYLRYYLGLELEPAFAMPPHRAAADVWVTAHILQKLLELRPIERLIEISKEPGFLKTFRFGKHAGKTFKEVAETDRSYLEWIVDKSDLDESVKFTAKWHLKRAEVPA